MIINKKIKEQRGIVIADAIISILIILLFVGIVASLMTNIVLESTKSKVAAKQMEIAQEILEYTDKLPYSETTTANLEYFINNMQTLNNESNFTVQVSVEPYNQQAGNTDKLDIIKIITVTVTSAVKGENRTTQIKTLKKMSVEEIKSTYGYVS